jgi:hypothetical protein
MIKSISERDTLKREEEKSKAMKKENCFNSHMRFIFPKAVYKKSYLQATGCE